MISDIAGILSKIEHVIVGVRYWFTAVLLFVFIVVLQQLEGNLIYPKVVGNSVGLPAIWVLAPYR